jgi:ATPase family protein associated with various cellular activities (AAA)
MRQDLCRGRRTEDGGQRRDRARAPALLVKGEPSTGKTLLAHEIASAIGAPLIRLARQIDHARPAGPLRIRRGVARPRDSHSSAIPPLHGALLKNEQGVHLFEKPAFLSRRER